MTVLNTGAFTCKLLLAGDTFSYSGKFSATGRATNYVAKSGKGYPISLWKMDLDTIDNEIQGNIYYDSSDYAGAFGNRALYDGVTSISPFAGLYTMIIPGTNTAGTNATGVPKGDGYGTVSIASNGSVVFSGLLSDNTALTMSTGVSEYGQWPLYASLASGQGTLWGLMTFTNNSEFYLQSNPGVVSEPAKAVAFYPKGFTNYVYYNWSTYQAPAVGERVMALTNGIIVFSGGNLTKPLTNSITLSIDNVITFDSTNSVSLNLTNGTFQGSFWHPVINQSVTFKGALIQEQATGHGFFSGTNAIGNVLIQRE
jgi:hypothetical protein